MISASAESGITDGANSCETEKIEVKGRFENEQPIQHTISMHPIEIQALILKKPSKNVVVLE